MNDQVSILDPCTAPEWMDLINTHPDAGVFHHPAWLTMIRDTYGYRIFAVCLKQGESLVGGIPFADVRSMVTGHRWVSVPFSDYCQPLFPPDNPEAVDTLMGYLKSQQGTVTPKIEIRWEVQTNHQTFVSENFVGHAIPLQPDPQEVFRTFKKATVWRHIRSTERNGIRLKDCASLDDFMTFYRLQVMTRRRLGVPAQPLAFFKAIWSYILQPGLGFCVLAYKGDYPIAGGVFFHVGRTAVYKYGASDYAYRSLNPNYAIMWEAIQRACRAGHSMFCLGRSDKNDEGLQRYKNGWGTIRRPLPYTVLADKPPRSDGSSTMENLVGTVIRHSPEFVCVTAGELLYRHFG